MEKNRIRMTDGWRFCLTEDEQAVLPAYDDSAWRVLDLPHDWQIEQKRVKDAPGGGAQGFYPREQMGVYRLHLVMPEAWRGKQVRVLFDGVQRFSTVFLNGQKVGGQMYGYTPFLCDLTDALVPGENLLAVQVDNRDRNGWCIASGDRWYSGAGIYRNVWLLVGEETRIRHDGVKIEASPVHRGPSGDVPDVAGIRCDLAKVAVRVECEGDLSGCTLRAEAIRDGDVVWSGETPAQAETKLHFEIHRPDLWSTETPALYTLVTMLDRNGEIVDEHSSRFGIRSAVFDSEDGFLLNGVKTKLWGVNTHVDGGVFGTAVPIEVWRRRIQAFKKLGANTIRFAHHPMAEEMVDLCDEVGMLVVDELYDKWSGSGMYYDALYDAEHEQNLDAMLRRDWNHPSVILWSVGNEVNHQYSERFFQCLKDLCDQVRRTDATRPVSAALIGFVLKDYNDVTPLGKKLDAALRYSRIVDVFMGNYMEQLYERLRAAGMRKPIIGSEVRMFYRHDDRFPDTTNVSPENPYAICKKHDWVCGALIWAGCDYLGESSGWPWRGWTGNPLDSTAAWKTRAWYVAAQWKNEPVLRLAVYDESEPWDGARGLWGFPQMRSHWKYDHFEKVFHVAVMTNCDTVKLYQNSQTVRIGYAVDSADGLIHFRLPYIPGVLRAEGYRGGLLVAQDVMYSDHEAAQLTVETDGTQLPPDGRSMAIVDVTITDAHGRRYELEDRLVHWQTEGSVSVAAADNGNAASMEDPRGTQMHTHNGHLQLFIRAGRKAGPGKLIICTEGFEEQAVLFDVK